MKTETKISNTALKNTKHKYLTTKKKENHDEKRNMENADTGYHQHSHRRSNYSRSNELHVEKAVKKKRKAARKRRQKIKALKEAKASSNIKMLLAFSQGSFYI